MIRTTLFERQAIVAMQVSGVATIKTYAYEIKQCDDGWFQTYASVSVYDASSGERISGDELQPFSEVTDSLQALRLWTYAFAKEKARNVAKYFRKKGEKVTTSTVVESGV